jgi:hypothetical protein
MIALTTTTVDLLAYSSAQEATDTSPHLNLTH